jgi:hypothetical protein
MKWLKRFFLAAVVLVAFLAASGVLIRRLARSRPDWYPAQLLDQAARSAAARSVEDKLIGVQNWALDTNANERNRLGGITPSSPGYTPAPDPVKHISFTEAELNAFFVQWDQAMHWKERYSEFIEDPVLALADDRIILAANVKELDAFVSVHFAPSLDSDGKLRLALIKVMGGTLPLPQAFWNGYRQHLIEAMVAKVKQSQKRARMAADGSMNHDAMVAAMNELLLKALQDEPADPVLFLRHDNLHDNALPVKLTGLAIAGKTIDLTVVPLNADERKLLLERIREPLDKSQAASDHAAAPEGPGPPR